MLTPTKWYNNPTFCITTDCPMFYSNCWQQLKFKQMDDFRYNRYGQVQTGFDNSIDHSMFGHWRNIEYQELCQEAEMIEREKQEMSEQPKDTKSTDDEDWLPF